MSVSVVDLLPSPCVGVCILDRKTGYCEGCARTGDEIAGWGQRSLADQVAVWSAIPERRSLSRVPYLLVPWGGVRLWVALATLAKGGTMRWQKGWAEIPLALDGLAPSGAADRKGLSLRAPSGRLQLRDAGGLRAFLHRIPGGYRLTLSQHQARFRTPRVAAVTDLGTDLRALTHQGRLHRFFDLALGDGAVRIATRSGNPRTVEALHSLCGRRFGAGEVQAKLQGLDDVILVAESPLGRLETMACGSAVPAVKAPILPAGYVALASADIADADALAAAGLDLAAISA